MPESCAQVATENRRIRIDTTIAQERPVAASVLDDLRITLRDENLGIRVRCVREEATKRVRNERMAEELDAVRARLILVTDAIRRRHEDAIRNRVRALH